MSTGKSNLDPSFIDQQREYLLRLRANLKSALQGTEAEEGEVRSEVVDAAREYEDDAQELDELEVGGNLVVRDLDRLTRVERALKKIDDGTYGVSDLSGEPIPRERLEAIPEAILTLSEEQRLEKH
jgi:DnaK suppressor protein